MIKQKYSLPLLNIFPFLVTLAFSGLFSFLILFSGALLFKHPVLAQSKSLNTSQLLSKRDPTSLDPVITEGSPVTPDRNSSELHFSPSGPAQRERIEADVSTRTISVTSGYSGAEVLVFGAVENGRQPTAEAGYYDIVVVVEGVSSPLTLRKKNRLAGLWVNTQSFKFQAVPTFYALATTRPIEQFVDGPKREELGLGFTTVSMSASSSKEHITSKELIEYKSAVVRLKQAQGLFSRDDKGVFFTGRSLFRSTIHLPATVPIGTLRARIYLFHEGVLLSSFTSQVMLEREGIERWIYAFAFESPFSYGILAVFLAIVIGLLGSALFHRQTI